MTDHEDAERTTDITQRPRWSFQVKLVVNLLLIALAAYLLSRFKLVIPPFILAAILAFILSPFVIFLEQRLHLNRVIGTLPPVVNLGIFAGAALAGIPGIPLAAPTIAPACVLGRFMYANLLDLDLFPVTVIQPTPSPNLYGWKRSRTGRKA